MNKNAEARADQLRQQFSGPMTEAEIAFCRDLAAFIDFGVRNGLNFSVVLSTLAHDVNGVAQAGFDFGQAKARGLVPKVTGYSSITADDFGEVEEADDSL